MKYAVNIRDLLNRLPNVFVFTYADIISDVKKREAVIKIRKYKALQTLR